MAHLARSSGALAFAHRAHIIGLVSPEATQEMLELAERLAREAAARALAAERPLSVTRKADNSLVTEIDHAIQARIVRAVTARFPDHAICAEETIEHPELHPDRTAARYCWVIDPLDGTRNYTCGFPCFATSIAVLDRGRPVVAVVHEHNLGAHCAAIAGAGVTLNGKPLSMATPKDDMDLIVGVPSSKDPLTVAVLRSWLATRGLICRNVGSTAWHLAMVASGALDAVFCKRCKIWDIAAGALLVAEAGGRVTDPFGNDCVPFDLAADSDADLPILAASAPAHARLLRSIDAVRSDNREP